MGSGFGAVRHPGFSPRKRPEKSPARSMMPPQNKKHPGQLLRLIGQLCDRSASRYGKANRKRKQRVNLRVARYFLFSFGTGWPASMHRSPASGAVKWPYLLMTTPSVTLRGSTSTNAPAVCARCPPPRSGRREVDFSIHDCFRKVKTEKAETPRLLPLFLAF